MFNRIVKEMRKHVPFTALGAVTGVIIMVIVIVVKTTNEVSEHFFHILHGLHILLSALVTTAMLRLHIPPNRDFGFTSIPPNRDFGFASTGKGWTAWLIGYVGSVGICSISDIFLPCVGGVLVGAEMKLHICLIEHWWLVTPSAVVGITIGYLRPTTKLPHAGHVLVSTWASLFMLTGFGMANWLTMLPFVFVILFFAVWLPCCLSDIVFPLLFVKK